MENYYPGKGGIFLEIVFFAEKDKMTFGDRINDE